MYRSTREPGEEGAGLLANGSDNKRVGAFDVEFDIEDDVLLNWQHARCEQRSVHQLMDPSWTL